MVEKKKHQPNCSGRHYADGVCFPKAGPVFPEDYAAEMKKLEAVRKSGGYNMKGPAVKVKKPKQGKLF